MLGPIRQAFLLRVILGILGISCVFALVASIYVVFQAYTNTMEMARSEARSMVSALRTPESAPLAAETLREKLRDFIQTRSASRRDHFVMGIIYDNAKERVAEALVPDRQGLTATLDRSQGRFPAGGDTWHTVHLVGNQLYVQVMTPLPRSLGDSAAYFEGVFMLSRKTFGAVFGAVRDLILKTVIVTILAGVATAQLLYPILKDQQLKIVEAGFKLLNENILSLKLLGNAIAKRDSDTHVHNFRVTLSSIRIAEALSRPEAEIQDLIKGAFLHDVGKIGISDNILLKQGELTDDERREMRRHVDYGVEIIAVSEWLMGAVDVVKCHHERYDGGGYPKGLAGEDIPINARIFTVADVFDALTSRRPYKEPYSLEKSMDILAKGRGGLFDPKVLDAFNQISAELHADLRGRDDDAIEVYLDDQIKRYFRV